jgi:tRNA pseudouridine13 synthase
MDYKIKQIDEDFIVKEIFDLKKKKLSDEFSNDKPFAYFLMKKKNWTTLRAVDLISESTHIPANRIGFAGNKDKNAITEQYISIKNGKKQFENLKFKNLRITFIGYSNEPVSLGDLTGNEFEIVVRNLEKTAEPKMFDKIPNYFGEQRFSKNNCTVGKLIIQKDFKQAAELLAKNETDLGPQISDFLKRNPRNYVGAIRLLPIKILKLYIHAYQSFLWNTMAEQYIKKQGKSYNDIKTTNIPLIGFQVKLENPEVKDIIKKIMKKEKLVQRNFIIREIPNLSSAGDYRALFVNIKNLKISPLQPDEINKDKLKCTATFKLTKGSYATIVIKELFS